MSNQSLDHIISLLTSSYWSERAEGVKKLEDFSSFEELKLLIEKIEVKNDNSLRLVLIDHLEKLLMEKSAQRASAAFILLVEYTEFSFKKLESKAKSIIRNYFETPRVFRYVKLAVIMRSWKHLPKDKLLFITKLISEFKIFELVSLAIENFESDDDDLIVATIEFFIRSGDKRGNRYYKKYLKDSDDELVVKKSIIALGALGNFFDYTHVQAYLNHENRSIRQAAIRSYIEILGRFAVNKLKEIYKTTEYKIDRLFIIKTLSMFQYDSSLEFLLDAYIDDANLDERNGVEWSIVEFSNKRRNRIYLRKFKSLDRQKKLKLLSLVADLPTVEMRDLLLNELVSSDDPNYTLMLVNSMYLFDSDPLVHKALIGLLDDLKAPVSYYALALLFKHTMTNSSEIILNIIARTTEESPHHHLILAQLANENIDLTINSKIMSYIKASLDSSKMDIVSLSIDATMIHYDNEIFKKLVHIKNERDEFQAQAYKAIGYIVSKNPQMLNEFPSLISDDDIVANVHKYHLETGFFSELYGVYEINKNQNWSHFFSKFSKYVCINLDKILNKEDLSYFEFILSFIEVKPRSISRFSLDYIVQNIYPGCRAELQEKILGLFVELKNMDHFEFILKETFKDKIITKKESEVISNFINALS